MHQILACLWHLLNWYYPLKSDEKECKETYDMKKLSVVILSMELFPKSSLTADNTRNIIMLLLSNVLIGIRGSCRFQLYVEFY